MCESGQPRGRGGRVRGAFMETVTALGARYGKAGMLPCPRDGRILVLALIRPGILFHLRIHELLGSTSPLSGPSPKLLTSNVTYQTMGS